MKVVIFSTCIVDLFFPNVGAAMVEVLERFGCEHVARISGAIERRSGIRPKG